MMRRRSSRRRGFTLLEILVVIAILGLLASVAVVKYMAYLEDAAVDTAKAKLREVRTALQAHYMRHQAYPEELLLLVEPEDEEEDGVLSRSALYDPWKNELIYSVTEGEEHPFQLISMGPDKQEGTEDDIDAWALDEETPEEEGY